MHSHLIRLRLPHFLSGFWTRQVTPHGDHYPPRTGVQESRGWAELGASVCSAMTPSPSPLLLGHADLKHASGIGLTHLATKGRQVHREAIGVFDRPLALLFGHAKERFDEVRADRQAHGVHAQRCGHPEMLVHPSLKAPAHWRGERHRLDNLVALLTRLLTEPLDFQDFLTLQEDCGVTPEQVNEGFTRGQSIQSASEFGSSGARSGRAWRRVLEQLIGPLDEAMH